MATAKMGMQFSVRTEPDMTGVVRAPDGRVVATTPDPVATGWLLGIIRLAAWAHKELASDPVKLYEVLQVNPAATEVQDVIDEATATLLGPKGEPL